jgi:hypothetical protein
MFEILNLHQIPSKKYLPVYGVPLNPKDIKYFSQNNFIEFYEPKVKYNSSKCRENGTLQQCYHA